MIKKKNDKKETSSLKRQFGVVLEDINSKIDLVVEGHQGLNQKIDVLDEKVDVLDKKVEGLDRKIDKVDEKLEDFRKEVNYKFDVVFDELHLIRNELKEKVGRDSSR